MQEFDALEPLSAEGIQIGSIVCVIGMHETVGINLVIENHVEGHKKVRFSSSS